MKADFSRSTFDPKKQYTTVRMQQGRMQLDADWNEQIDILVHLLRAQARDLLGPYGAPLESAGFAISLLQSNDLQDDLRIAAGRYYVDGILVENDGDTLFSAQPYWPGANLKDATPARDRFVVYLDVWERHLSGSEAPSILEPALGGVDTTTRTQTIWQVKLWSRSSDDGDSEPATTDDLLRSWNRWRDQQIRQGNPGSPGTLRPRVIPAGYGLTNQLYRVEIHTGGDEATFKWSRDNGSVAFVVTSLQLNDTVLTATLEGLSAETDLPVGAWMELVDAVFELDARPAPLFKVTGTPHWDLTSATVTLERADKLSERDVQDIQAIGQRLAHGRRTQPDELRAVLRRWDYREFGPGVTLGEDGAIQVRPGQWLPLENGIEVRFEGAGELRTGDYWLIPARSAAEGYTLLWPDEPVQIKATSGNVPVADPAAAPVDAPQSPSYATQAAQRVEHHLAPLAVLLRNGTDLTVSDLRKLFQPLASFEADETAIERRLQKSMDALRSELAEEAAATLAAMHQIRDEIARMPAAVFPLADPAVDLEPGQVVALVPVSGGIELAKRSNASLVAGVALGPFGNRVDLDQITPSYWVAQSGRHECLVVGRVEPGDLLVPSDVPGCAVSAGIFIQPGTVIGKALQSHHPSDGRDRALIAVMVTLR